MECVTARVIGQDVIGDFGLDRCDDGIVDVKQGKMRCRPYQFRLVWAVTGTQFGFNSNARDKLRQMWTVRRQANDASSFDDPPSPAPFES